MKRKIITLVAKLLFTILIIYFLVYRISFKNIIADISSADTDLLLLAVLFTVLQTPIKIYKWTCLVRIHKPDFSFKEGAVSFLQGMTLATITPFAVGELTRGSFVKSDIKLQLTGKVILDKILDLMSVTLLSLTGLLLYFHYYFLLALCIIIYGVVILNFPSFIHFCFRIFPKSLSRSKICQNINSGLTSVTVLDIVRNNLLSLIYFLFFYCQAFLLLSAFSSTPPQIQALFFFPLVTLSTIIPLTISGTGIREGVAIYLMEQFEVSSSVAFNTFFTQFIIANILLSIIGYIFIISADSTHHQKKSHVIPE